MTANEKKEIAATVRFIMEDECDEIRKPYIEYYGSTKGLKNYIRNECVSFWTDANPYLDKEYLDYSWLKVGNKIINVDDVWCFIRDGLKELVASKR